MKSTFGLFVSSLLLWSPPPPVDGFTSVVSSKARSHRQNKQLLHQCCSHRGAMTQCRRVSVAGVSVAPSGFWAFLQIPQAGDSRTAYHWPLQLTCSPQDATSAQSPEALTILQLIAGVDMAGAILPPDILAKLVVLHAEEEPGSLNSNAILEQISLPQGMLAYSELNDWQRSKLNLPQVTLDELTLDGSSGEVRLDVSVAGLGPLSFCPSQDALGEVCWNYNPASSLHFVSLALALRFKAPIVMDMQEQDKDDKTNKQLLTKVEDEFPLYTTVGELHKTSSRSAKNVEKSFEMHKLSGALRIAMELGDEAAEEKIRQALEDLELKPSVKKQPEDLSLDLPPQLREDTKNNARGLSEFE